MRRAIPWLAALALLSPRVGAAAGPDPSVPLAPVAPKAADPLTDIGAVGILGGTFAFVVLIACAASKVNDKGVEASGITSLALFGAGIPMVAIGRAQQSVAWVPPLTFTASTRGAALSWRRSF